MFWAKHPLTCLDTYCMKENIHLQTTLIILQNTDQLKNYKKSRAVFRNWLLIIRQSSNTKVDDKGNNHQNWQNFLFWKKQRQIDGQKIKYAQGKYLLSLDLGESSLSHLLVSPMPSYTLLVLARQHQAGPQCHCWLLLHHQLPHSHPWPPSGTPWRSREQPQQKEPAGRGWANSQSSWWQRWGASSPSCWWRWSSLLT